MTTLTSSPVAPLLQRLFAEADSALSPALHAQGFFEDSKASITARNYYFDRGCKGASAHSATRE